MSDQPTFEEKYYDILRSIETQIYNLYLENPHLLDYSVEKALNGMVRTLNNQKRGRSAPNLRLKEDEQAVYRQLQALATLYTGQDESVKPDQLLTVDEMVACLKRILRSQKQMSSHGRQGYVNFLKQFFGE